MFSTYVLYSTRFDKIYIGQTEDIDRRFLTHNSDQNDGWTASFKPWELLHLEIFETRAQAMKREKQLKSFQGRVFIRSLIEQKTNQ